MIRSLIAHLSTYARVARAGLCDGIAQPHDLSTTTSVDALIGPDADASDVDWQEVLDAWATRGQVLRSPLRHQRA